jgi:Rod binding domain-containing protein
MLAIAGTEAAVSSATATSSPRFVSAAHEFEAQMMQELLKPLSSTSGLDGEDDDSASGSGSALGEFASETLGKALSEQGGFGIATSIVRQLSSTSNKNGRR